MTYPNVLVMGYLEETGQLTPEWQMKLEEAINLGYQRVLTFEVKGGGFDWYGNAPANTMLTAYGILMLNDMKKVYPIDTDVIDRASRLLFNRQKSDGSWPLDYAVLVQPVLDRQCVNCHRPGTDGAKFDLTAAKSYDSLVNFGTPSLKEVVIARYQEQRSKAGECEAQTNAVLRLLRQGHYDVQLTPDDWSRLITWMDTLGQRAGHFSPQQEEQLRQLRHKLAGILEP